MQFQILQQKIESKQARLGVIGLGYVGLPVAALFARTGFDVLGIDLKADRVAQINAGQSPIEGDEPGLAEVLAEAAASGRLRAATGYEGLRDCDVILIDVETPVDEANIPQYAALRSALNSLAVVLKESTLVIVESTIAPGTMANLVCPTLEAGSNLRLNRGFALGNCPERVMPGRLIRNLTTLSRVLGAASPETAAAMQALYRNVVQAELDSTDWITAELVKTVENTYRDVQIAFANEVALICEQVGADVWAVRELVNKSPYRAMHLPGAGVGGHCIPKDPWLLAYSVQANNLPLRLIPAARAVNDTMPLHTAALTAQALQSQGGTLSGARILVLGVAYLPNSDDTRNSPTTALAAALRSQGAEVLLHDPFVSEYQGDVVALAEGCDAVVLMVAHQNYAALDLPALRERLRRPILVDGRAAIDPLAAQQAGLYYTRLGLAASHS